VIVFVLLTYFPTTFLPSKEKKIFMDGWHQAVWLAGWQLNAKACFLIIIKAKIKYVAYTHRK